MHVSHLSTQMGWGGGEKQVLYLLRHLQRRGVAQTLFCPYSSALGQRAAAAGHEVVFLAKFPRSFLAWMRALRQKTSPLRAHALFHAHDSQAHACALTFTKLFRSKIPLFVHRRMISTKLGFFSSLKYNDPAIRNIICISSPVLDCVRASLHEPHKAVLIPSGIDLAEAREGVFQTKAEARKALGLPENGKIVLNIGSLVPQKRQEFFLQIARDLARKNNPMHFYVLGEGPCRLALEAFIREHSLSSFCHLLGKQGQVNAYLQAADLLLITAKDEALGNVIMEAFLAGTPVVSARSGGVLDLIEHSKSGLLVDPDALQEFGTSIQGVLQDQALAQTLKDGAFAKLRDFDINVTCERILQLYNGISDGP